MRGISVRCSEPFEERYTRPGEEKKGWKVKSNWLARLVRIRNENAHTYSVSEDEYNAYLKTLIAKGQIGEAKGPTNANVPAQANAQAGPEKEGTR